MGVLLIVWFVMRMNERYYWRGRSCLFGSSQHGIEAIWSSLHKVLLDSAEVVQSSRDDGILLQVVQSKDSAKVVWSSKLKSSSGILLVFSSWKYNIWSGPSLRLGLEDSAGQQRFAWKSSECGLDFLTWRFIWNIAKWSSLDMKVRYWRGLLIMEALLLKWSGVIGIWNSAGLSSQKIANPKFCWSDLSFWFKWVIGILVWSSWHKGSRGVSVLLVWRFIWNLAEVICSFQHKQLFITVWKMICSCRDATLTDL